MVEWEFVDRGGYLYLSRSRDLIVDEEHDCHLEDYALTFAVEARARENSLKEMMHELPDSLEKTERRECYARRQLRVSKSGAEIW